MDMTQLLDWISGESDCWLNASSAVVPLGIKGGNLCESESEELCIRVGGVNLEGHVW